jgi:hypothetical protein
MVSKLLHSGWRSLTCFRSWGWLCESMLQRGDLREKRVHWAAEHDKKEGQASVEVSCPLRIGIMLDSLRGNKWVAKILADIQSSDFAEIVLVLLNDAPLKKSKPTVRGRLKAYWIHGLYNRYTQWDYRRHRQEPDAFEAVDLSQLVKDAEVLPVKPVQKGFVDRFEEADLVRVREANIDVMFRFGFRIIRGDILSSACYGVWSFHHDDNREYRGAPPGFWEMYEGNPVSGTILQILTDTLDGGHVIYRSWSATNFKSLYLNRNARYWKTANFAIRRLRDLHRYGWDYIRSLPEYTEQDQYMKPIYKTPRAPVMAKFLARQAFSRLWPALQANLFVARDQWFVALRKRHHSRDLIDNQTGFRLFPSPKGHFYADPCLIKKGGKNYLFFEDFGFREGKAVISCMELDADGNGGNPEVVLERPYHLSYPFVFEWQGQTYMLPETKLNSAVELYRAQEFPRTWALEKVLLRNLQAVDPTLLQYDDKFWLFVNIAAAGASVYDELHVFYSDSPLGEWTAHPKNPVVSDVRRARPAGALFFDKGELIRPSQDCSLRYGYALVLNRVDVLSESDYRETPVRRVEPVWQKGNLCTHTYSRTEDFEALDGMFAVKELCIVKRGIV